MKWMKKYRFIFTIYILQVAELLFFLIPSKLLCVHLLCIEGRTIIIILYVWTHPLFASFHFWWFFFLFLVRIARVNAMACCVQYAYSLYTRIMRFLHEISTKAQTHILKYSLFDRKSLAIGNCVVFLAMMVFWCDGPHRNETANQFKCNLMLVLTIEMAQDHADWKYIYEFLAGPETLLFCHLRAAAAAPAEKRLVKFVYYFVNFARILAVFFVFFFG